MNTGFVESDNMLQALAEAMAEIMEKNLATSRETGYIGKKKGGIVMDLKNDIKTKLEEIVQKLRADDKLLEKFRQDPVKTLEGLLGVDLPDDKLKELAGAVQAKLDVDKLSGALGGLKNFLGK